MTELCKMCLWSRYNYPEEPTSFFCRKKGAKMTRQIEAKEGDERKACKRYEAGLPLRDADGKKLRGMTRDELREVQRASAEDLYKESLQKFDGSAAAVGTCEAIVSLSSYTLTLVDDIIGTNVAWLADTLKEEVEFKSKGSKFHASVLGLAASAKQVRKAERAFVSPVGPIWSELSEAFDDAMLKHTANLRKIFRTTYEREGFDRADLHAQLDVLKILCRVHFGLASALSANHRLASSDGHIILRRVASGSNDLATLTAARGAVRFEYGISTASVRFEDFDISDVGYYIEQIEEVVGFPPDIEAKDGLAAPIRRAVREIVDFRLTMKVLDDVRKKHEGETMPYWWPVCAKSTQPDENRS